MIPIQNGLKQGDALSPLIINSALEYSIRKLQENQGLNGKGQITFWCMMTMVIDWRKYKYYQEHRMSIRAGKDNVLDVKAGKTKYILMSTQNLI
jgi:hypothetical protein